jgi:UDP-GlcNAc:undecaprenyl-phosphate GlcNAc-1-phosphate transferase
MNAYAWQFFWQPAILAAAVAFVVSGIVVATGKGLKIIDDPKKHRHPKVVHERPVPRGGGIPIFCALAMGGWMFLSQDTRIAGVLGAAAMLAAVGFLDDRYEEAISPYLRLIINLLAALCVIGVGTGIAYITNPLGGVLRLDMPKICFWLWGSRHCIWLLSDLFALIWLVWMQNIVGWSSGVDGQLPGFVIVAAITIAILGLRAGGDSSQITVVVLAGLIAGAYAGFLPWNWYPQKIMPGYGGKSLAGFLLGLLAILSGAKVGAMFMVLAIPFVDAFLVIIKRVREGRSPVWGGHEHLHHMLLDRGWGRRRIALFYWGISLVMAIGALQLKAGLKYFTMATVLLVVTGGIWWLQNWSIYSKQPGQGNG